MNLHRRWVVGVPLLLLACSNKDDAAPEPSESDGPVDISDVVYVGGTTDEALLRMLDSKIKDDVTQYVSVEAPDLNEALAADTPATFEFHLASEAKHLGTPRALPVQPPAWQRAAREVLKLLGPPRVAYAHGTPYNGTAYFLTISDADAKAQLRVFTNKASYTPDAAAWESLTNAAQPLTLEISSAFFDDNDVTADGGPFVGGSFDFRIE
jgi:hypothetical protein